MSKRPLGVTILGMLAAVNGSFQFFVSFAFSSGFWRGLPLLLSILSFIVAFGLLLGEEWAWTLTLVLDLIYLTFTIALFALRDVATYGMYVLFMMYPSYTYLLSMIAASFRFQLPFLTDIIVIAPLFVLPFVIVLYLMVPHVKEFFLKA